MPWQAGSERCLQGSSHGQADLEVDLLELFGFELSLLVSEDPDAGVGQSHRLPDGVLGHLEAMSCQFIVAGVQEALAPRFPILFAVLACLERKVVVFSVVLHQGPATHIRTPSGHQPLAPSPKVPKAGVSSPTSVL